MTSSLQLKLFCLLRKFSGLLQHYTNCLFSLRWSEKLCWSEIHLLKTKQQGGYKFAKDEFKASSQRVNGNRHQEAIPRGPFLSFALTTPSKTAKMEKWVCSSGKSACAGNLCYCPVRNNDFCPATFRSWIVYQVHSLHIFIIDWATP